MKINVDVRPQVINPTPTGELPKLRISSIQDGDWVLQAYALEWHRRWGWSVRYHAFHVGEPKERWTIGLMPMTEWYERANGDKDIDTGVEAG